MGGTLCDSYIELRDDREWELAFYASSLLKAPTRMRSEILYWSLFTGCTNFTTPFEGRGIPNDVSFQVGRQCETAHVQSNSDDYGHTWCTWSELAAVDWDVEEHRESGSFAENTIFEKFEDLNGDLVFRGRVFDDDATAYFMFNEEREYRSDRFVFRRAKMTLRDAIPPKTEVLFAMMEAAAERLGGDNVRLVVWFYPC